MKSILFIPFIASVANGLAFTTAVTRRSNMRMDSGETMSSSFRSRIVPSSSFQSLPLKQPKQQFEVVDEINCSWQHESIDPGQELTFMKFWKHQMEIMQNSLTDLEQVSVTSRDGNNIDLSFNEVDDTRIINQVFKSKDFRKIRMAYYDGGAACQVYTSIFYPDPKYDLPVFGIDLLQFHGGKKNVIAIDFQPLDGSDHHHDSETVIQAIREQFPSLQGKMSERFYDQTKFSDQMLFGRFDEAEEMEEQTWPAFQQYLEAYLDLVKSSEPSDFVVDQVMEKQKNFDVYFAEHDRAKYMLQGKFGEEWTEAYVHDFLFDLSR